jgi:MoxR-like ATPase
MSEIESFAGRCERLLVEVERAIVGKRETLELVLLGLLADGHVLIEDYPGLAKTLIARSFAQVTGMDFSRVQFTPDLMPSDVTGSSIFNQRTTEFEFRPGPIFTNLLLADEINRAPPKTQAALLEAMQERQVTIEGKTHPLARPFVVLATQNPIEYEGTYPLPEAQLDRFMFEIVIAYLDENQEVEVVQTTTSIAGEGPRRAITASELTAFQQLVRKVPASDAVARYAVTLARMSRPSSKDAPDLIKKWVQYGASVRAAQYLILGGKARALMHGRYHVGFEDIRALAGPVLRHRIIMNFNAQSEKVTTDQIIAELIRAVPTPRSGM